METLQNEENKTGKKELTIEERITLLEISQHMTAGWKIEHNDMLIGLKTAIRESIELLEHNKTKEALEKLKYEVRKFWMSKEKEEYINKYL